MKKILFFFSAIVLTLTLVSCNSDSRPTGFGYVSVEGFITPEGILDDGSEIVVTHGNLTLPELGDYSRARYLMSFYYMDETRPAGEGTSSNVELYYYEPMLMKSWESPGTAETNDPVCEIYLTEMCWNNYIDLQVTSWAYKKNAEKDDYYAMPDYTFEFDPEIIPGTEIDTINVNLKYFANRAEDEYPAYSKPVGMNIAIDIEGLADNYYIDLDHDATYVIKINALRYAETESANDEKVKNDFYTTKWIPNQKFYPKND